MTSGSRLIVYGTTGYGHQAASGEQDLTGCKIEDTPHLVSAPV